MKATPLMLAICAPMLVMTGSVEAAINGQIQARLTISAGCEVTSGGTGGSNTAPGDFGLLDFGQQGPTWSGPINANLGTDGNRLAVTCNPSVPGFTVRIDGGVHGDGSTRKLSNGSVSIPYKLYFDAGGNDAYAIDQIRNFPVATGSAVAIPVFGAVDANTSAVPAGVYTDTLMVTLDW